MNRLLGIPHTAVIISNLVPREEGSARPGMQSDMSVGTKQVRVMVQSYQAEGKIVRLLDVSNDILEKGSATKRDVRSIKKGALKDGVHMSDHSTKVVAKKLLFCISKMPTLWFPIYHQVTNEEY